jgi:hypothetical protein
MYPTGFPEDSLGLSGVPCYLGYLVTGWIAALWALRRPATSRRRICGLLLSYRRCKKINAVFQKTNPKNMGYDQHL